ncbi:MAG: PIG-L family deacetylase [Armatimonadetes bacterium]|nr:PIG-L family deacetylase [Armatimonadota bacterium]
MHRLTTGFALLLGISLLLGLAPLALSAESPPDLLKTDLMVVVAHPDDEGMAAAAMARYALGEGKTVATVHATRGEGGGNEVGTQLGPALGQLREAELRAALRVMGVHHLYFLDKTDWAYTESAKATLDKWGHDDSLGRLVRLIRNLRPEVMVTFFPAPTGGQHGHHQAAGILATEAFDSAADPAAFPDQLKREGLRPWQVKRLFYVGERPGVEHVSLDVSGKAVDGRSFAEIASEAMSRHQSQGFGGFGGFRGPPRPSTFTLAKSALPPDTLSKDDLLAGLNAPGGFLATLEPETYRVPPGGIGALRLVLMNTGDKPLDFLSFHPQLPDGWGVFGFPALLGLQPGERRVLPLRLKAPASVPPGPAEIPIEIRIRAGDFNRNLEIAPRTTVKVSPLVEAEVIPLPAIVRYREWTRDQRIERFAGALPSCVPLAAGQPGTVMVQLTNRGVKERRLSVRLDLPDGWKSEPPSSTVAVPGGGRPVLSFRVTPPVDAKVADVPFTAVVSDSESKPLLTAEGVAQVTPATEVSRIAAAPKIDGDLDDWKADSEIRIPSTNVVQGQFGGNSDGSASARLAYDDRFFYVGVRVKDETVVSNIAPDDIKAHWRTDSVEITVDPQPRSEATLTTFKAGIFPWDTAGKVRAARDADANPGPIEETAPGMRLASKRTTDGYMIETAIPWSAIGAKPESGKRLGFNLLLYDGDRKDARVGDGIGEGRLAWSPRPGVWGRPEQWGEIRLK